MCSMSMSMGMDLRQSQRLEMRAILEQRLTQAMRCEMTQKLEMRMYLRREDECKKLYEKALERGDVHAYQGHGLTFEYARVRRAELPRDVAAMHSCGFAHCLFSTWEALLFGKQIALARGSWLLFVVPDFFEPAMPETYLQYVAVHEHGEEATLGQHDLATKLEFAISKQEREITRYLQWLEDRYPEKFTDVFANQTRIVLPDSDEFQAVLNLRSQAEYAQRVREMIEGFEWPYRLLQKLSLYERKSRDVEDLIRKACASAVNIAGGMPTSMALSEVVGKVREVLAAYLRPVKEGARFICWPRAKEVYREARSSIATAFDHTRERRKRHLEEDPSSYVRELQSLGGAGVLPLDGVLATKLDDALAAVA